VACRVTLTTIASENHSAHAVSLGWEYKWLLLRIYRSQDAKRGLPAKIVI
jgi:hypothetical protein